MKNFDLWKEQIPEIVGSFEQLADIYENMARYSVGPDLYIHKLISYYNNYLDFTNLSHKDIDLYDWILQAEYLINKSK